MNSDVFELLLVCESTSQPWPVAFYNPINGASVWSYKGSELQSECIADIALVCGEYLLISTTKRPTLLAISLESKNRTVQRSVIPGCVHCLASTSDGRVCCGAINEKLYAWMLNSGHLTSIVSMHYQAITKIRFSSDNSYVITASKDGSIVVLNLGDLVNPQDDVIAKTTPVHKFSAHSLSVTDVKVGHGGIASLVYSVSLDQTAKIHSLSSGELLMTLLFDCGLTACTVDNAETRLFVGTAKGDIRIVELFLEPVARERHIDLELDSDLFLFKGHKQSVTSMDVNIDGTILVSSSNDSELKLWHIGSRQCIRSISCKGPTKSQFVQHAPLIFDPNHGIKSLIRPLQKVVASKCEEFAPVRLTNHRINEYTNEKKVDDMLNRLIEEEDFSFNDETGVKRVRESREAEHLRKELTKAKKLNTSLYQFCVEKIITGTTGTQIPIF